MSLTNNTAFHKKSGILTNPLQFVVPRYCRDIGRTSLKYGGSTMEHCRYKLLKVQQPEYVQKQNKTV